MKLLLLSDLHLEFASFNVDPSTLRAADAVVLAGDIAAGVDGIVWARRVFANLPVFYVAGNHEFYRGHWTRTLDEMRQAAHAHDVTFLEDDAIVLQNTRFLGCTLWTDFNFFGESAQLDAMESYERGLNDCVLIAADPLREPLSNLHGRRLTAVHVLRRFQRSFAWLQAQLQQPHAGSTVVITHHLPGEQSVPERYRDSRLTPGFACKLPVDTVAKADVWLHGHTHDSCDYLYAPLAGAPGTRPTTRIGCNPRGYPRPGRFENLAFDPGKLVDLALRKSIEP